MIQIFFQDIDVKYFIIINNNSFSSSNFDKMNLLNQMLESIKFKDEKLRLKRDIIKENKGKIENSS